MKVLRVIGLVLLALVLIVIVRGYSKPAEFEVSRSLEINAPIKAVWPHLVSLKAADEWSHWMRIDPEVKKTYSDEEGVVGSWAQWDSENPNLGHGKQTITKIVEGKRIESKLELEWGDPSLGYWEVSEADSKTTVVYGFEGANNGFMNRVMGGFFDFDAEVGPFFEKGLANLKEIVEAEQSAQGQAAEKTYRGYTISKMTKPQLVGIGKRKVLGQDEITAFFSKVFPAAGVAASMNKLNMDGMPCGVYFDWNEEDKTADLFALMPVVADTNLSVEGFETLVVPEGKAYVIDHYGPYEASAEAHYAMDDMLKETNAEEPKFVIEQYMNDPSVVAPEKIHTRIFYVM